MPHAAFCLAYGAAIASLISIAACQILTGAALAAILLARERLRLPPIASPLALFVLLTLVAVAVSPDPRAGLPQVKKLYVFLVLPVVFTMLRRLSDIRRLTWWWAAAASASALWSFGQFWEKRQQAIAQGSDLYSAYVGDRVTGFMGHWMTFGAAQMAALLLLLSLLMFAPPRRYRWLLILAAVLISASIVIGWTRGVWLASALSGGYLVAVWRPKLLWFAPLVMLAGWFIAPRAVRERVISIYKPHGTTDSNLHRSITRAVGMEMIKSHPWFGLGPEMPGKEFARYIPAQTPLPLPAGYYGHLHNLYLQYAAERGLPALAVFLWLIAVMLRDWGRRALSTTDRQARAILHGCIAVVVAFLIEGLFEYNLGDSEVLSTFWIVVAYGYRAAEVQA